MMISRICSSNQGGGRVRAPRAFWCMSGVLLCIFSALTHERTAYAHGAHRSTGNVLLDEAIDAQAHHDFDRALALVEQSLADDPQNDAAWLQRMALHLIRGETDAARRSCRALRHSPPLVAITCHARVAHALENGGDLDRQLAELLTQTPAGSVEPTVLAWSYSVAADPCGGERARRRRARPVPQITLDRGQRAGTCLAR